MYTCLSALSTPFLLLIEAKPSSKKTEQQAIYIVDLNEIFEPRDNRVNILKESTFDQRSDLILLFWIQIVIIKEGFGHLVDNFLPHGFATLEEFDFVHKLGSSILDNPLIDGGGQLFLEYEHNVEHHNAILFSKELHGLSAGWLGLWLFLRGHPTHQIGEGARLQLGFVIALDYFDEGVGQFDQVIQVVCFRQKVQLLQVQSLQREHIVDYPAELLFHFHGEAGCLYYKKLVKDIWGNGEGFREGQLGENSNAKLII